jgi:hypothetical protein
MIIEKKISGIVMDRMVTGLSQYLSAEAAGSGRSAISDAYQSVDNFFAALLCECGEQDSRIHGVRLQTVLDKFGGLLQNSGVTSGDLKKFLECWKDVRYGTCPLTPAEIREYLTLAHSTIAAVICEIARRNSMSSDKLEEELYQQVLGGRWTVFNEAQDHAHEFFQMDAEAAGERGIGSKTGNKLTNPSNFCKIESFADDALTRGIIADDPEIEPLAGKLYKCFVELVSHIELMRFVNGVSSEEVSDFMMSVRLGYHGVNMKEFSEDVNRAISEALSDLKDGKRENIVVHWPRADPPDH